MGGTDGEMEIGGTVEAGIIQTRMVVAVTDLIEEMRTRHKMRTQEVGTMVGMVTEVMRAAVKLVPR